MRGVKYQTEEERLAAKKEANKRWREKNPDYDKKRYQEHKEELLEMNKQYQQKHKEEKAKYGKQYRQEHKEELAEYQKQYQQEHKEEIAEIKRQYNKTPMGRALYLLNGYRKSDKKYNRGECTLTAQWIIDNIFPKPCHWCGETGWEIMGCDRINNELPHTPDNVIPCCEACNKKRGRKAYEEFKEALRAEEID